MEAAEKRDAAAEFQTPNQCVQAALPAVAPAASAGHPELGGAGAVQFALFRAKLKAFATDHKQAALQSDDSRLKLQRAQENLRAAENAVSALKWEIVSNGDSFDGERTKIGRQCEERVRAAEGSALEAQAEAKSTRRQLEFLRDTIQTLQSERTEHDESARDLQSEVETLRARLKEQESIAAGFEISFSAIAQQIIEITEAEIAHKRDVDALRETHAALLATCESVKEAARAKAREAEEQAAARRAAEAERDELAGRLAKSEARGLELQNGAMVLSAAGEASATLAASLRAEREEWVGALQRHRRLLEGLAGEIAAREASARAAHERCDAALRAGAKLEAEMAEERSGRSKAEEMAIDFENEARRLRGDVQRLTDEAADRSRRLEALEVEVAALRATRGDLEARLAALDAAAREASGRAEAADARAAAAAAAREAAEAALALRIGESVLRSEAAREVAEAVSAARAEGERAAAALADARSAARRLEAELAASEARADALRAAALRSEREALQAASPVKPAPKLPSPTKSSPAKAYPPPAADVAAAAKGKSPLAGLKERPPLRGCLAGPPSTRPPGERRVVFAMDLEEEAEEAAEAAEGAPLQCFCGEPGRGLMASCAACRRSFHGACLARAGQALPLGGRVFVCAACAPAAGPSAGGGVPPPAPAPAPAPGPAPFDRKRRAGGPDPLAPAAIGGAANSAAKKKQKVARLSF